tara:strand:- start:1651 stop:2616 length:966 start_codon:yes stop_codon:yes gene_type:complete
MSRFASGISGLSARVRAGVLAAIVGFAFALSHAGPGLAQEDLPPSDSKQQTQAEKENKNSFFVRAYFGVGVCPPCVDASTGLRDNSGPANTALERLDLTSATGLVPFGLSGGWQFNDRKTAVFATIPAAMVEEEFDDPSVRLPGLKGQTTVALGDVSIGASHVLWDENETWPKVMGFAIYDSATGTHTPVSDGSHGLTGGIQLRKYVTDKVYLLGRASFTHRLEKAGVQLGSIVDLSFGAGSLIFSGTSRLEGSINFSRTADATIDDATLDGGSSVGLGMSLSDPFGSGMRWSLSINDIQNLKFDESSYYLRVSYDLSRLF